MVLHRAILRGWEVGDFTGHPGQGVLMAWCSSAGRGGGRAGRLGAGLLVLFRQIKEMINNAVKNHGSLMGH